MRLTQYTDYSLRILIFLGSLDEGELTNVQDIASIYHISKHHLTKIVHHLGKLGLVQTLRGRGGGIRLAKSPKDINLGWVIRQTEEDFYMVECFNKEQNSCLISSVCILKGVFNQALRAYITTLDQYTLADILSNKTTLQPLFAEGKSLD
ncbi:HTH-type transcriptional regulator NsrR [Pullulanibacillus camelliae]|uniref:HTH-type transcriptional regulator NsrR n=1 Tax=Pullulanibacillus camelliae TaxID=1707096 RepID=A0A8J2YM54_9BACL|nr:Rrf2 family transcriptional regulator [Pullulanibacillus camelliae]GGE53179.1 HTH-type transcriptional regulator NsrR [Pullulanibacillus camelliae]